MFGDVVVTLVRPSAVAAGAPPSPAELHNSILIASGHVWLFIDIFFSPQGPNSVHTIAMSHGHGHVHGVETRVGLHGGIGAALCEWKWHAQLRTSA